MAELKDWQDLAAGGVVQAKDSPTTRTGGWRTGTKPVADFSKCVNCLLCWLYCPDSAVRLDGTTFVGFDYDVCKGCELCVEVCPIDGITMELDDGD